MRRTGPAWAGMGGPALAAAVVLGTLLAAWPLATGLAGRGWAWPPTHVLLSVALGAVLHPGTPAKGWPPGEQGRLPGAAFYWSAFAGLAVVVAGLACAARSVRSSPRRQSPLSGYPGRLYRRPPHSRWPCSGSPYPRAPYSRATASGGRGRARPRGRGAPRGRRPRGRLARAGAPLRDRRDRYGMAGRRELFREASVRAARRRAAQTRPSIAGGGRGPGRRLRANDVGYPLGTARPSGVALWPSWEASLRLVAPPGEGKTFRALAPILRQHPGAALATSTKADLYELSAPARQRRGPVVALDPDGLVPAAAPARWSPVTGCERSEVAERRAAALVAATADESDTQNGAFFRDSARDLLKAYLHAAALEGLDIRAVLDWSRHPEDPAPAEALATTPWAAPGWGDLIALQTTGAAETTSGVMRYVARALACFSHQAVVEACCPPPGSELDLAELIRANGTLYLLGKASRLGAVAPLLTALADEFFDCAERLAATMPNRRMDPPVLGLLDEAPSIAPLPGLPELLADGRGRGIVMVYAMQSFSQAVTRWGAAKAETMGNATTITAVFGGLTSPGDLADLERLCGQRRARRSTEHHGGGGPSGPGRSRTVSWETEPVLRADEIRTLPSGTALVLWSKLPPVLAHLSLMSERGDWALVDDEQSAVRAANDQARAGLT